MHEQLDGHPLRALRLERGQGALPGPEADSLIENYRNLLRIECILRRWSFEGEAVLPDDPAALGRVAIRCGFAEAASFMSAVGQYRAAIRRIYPKVLEAVS